VSAVEPVPSLAELAAIANREDGAIRRAMHTTIEHAMKAGDAAKDAGGAAKDAAKK